MYRAREGRNNLSAETARKMRGTGLLIGKGFPSWPYLEYAPWYQRIQEPDLLAGRRGGMGWDGNTYDVGTVIAWTQQAPTLFDELAEWWDGLHWGWKAAIVTAGAAPLLGPMGVLMVAGQVADTYNWAVSGARDTLDWVERIGSEVAFIAGASIGGAAWLKARVVPQPNKGVRSAIAIGNETEELAAVRAHVERRMGEIRKSMGSAHRFGETYAMGAVRGNDGIKFYVVSKGKGVTKVNSSLLPGEELVARNLQGDLHAEMVVEQIASSRGETLLGVGATRPVCATWKPPGASGPVPYCQWYLDQIGVPIWTPRK